MGRKATGTVRAAYGRIQIGYTPAPKKPRVWFTVPNLKPTQANVELVRRNVEQYIREHRTGVGTRFVDAAQAYLDAADIKLSTRNSYRDSLNIYWLPALETEDVLAVTYYQLNQIDRAISWPSDKTRRNALCALRGVFRFAYSLHDRPWRSSPAHSLEMGRRQTEAREPNPYTRDERRRIIEAGSMYEWLAFGTGMRTGEIIALTWSAYENGRFRVSESRVRRELGGTKTHRARMVAVPEWLQARLETHDTRDLGQTILLNQYRRPYLSGYHLNKQHRALLARLGIAHREGPYPWRHTYASLSLMDGASPEFVAQQLGHSVPTLRKHYGRWIPGEYDNREMEKMSW